MLAGTITLKLSTFFSVSLYSNSILTGKQLPSVESLKEKRTNFQRKTVKEQKKKLFPSTAISSFACCAVLCTFVERAIRISSKL